MFMCPVSVCGERGHRTRVDGFANFSGKQGNPCKRAAFCWLRCGLMSRHPAVSTCMELL